MRESHPGSQAAANSPGRKSRTLPPLDISHAGLQLARQHDVFLALSEYVCKTKVPVLKALLFEPRRPPSEFLHRSRLLVQPTLHRASH